MNVNYMRTATAKDSMINEIIDIEWNMFDKVLNAGGRAGCQDDRWTFYVMRYSQFNSFDEVMLSSYRQDLAAALSEGRNVLTEKYGYMMEYTDPDYFDSNLRNALPQVSPAKQELVDRIANMLIGFEQEFDASYPRQANRSRPLTGSDKGDVSFHIYAIGELKTYSEHTLSLYLEHLNRCRSENVNPSYGIHQTTAEFYGYDTLDAAENSIR